MAKRKLESNGKLPKELENLFFRKRKSEERYEMSKKDKKLKFK